MKTEDLIVRIATGAAIPKRTARRLMAEFTKTAIDELRRGRCFVFPGLGRMIAVHRKGRWGRNPQSGQRLWISANTFIRVSIDKKIRELLSPKSLRPVVRIFYATDRQPNHRGRTRYESRRSSTGELHLGTCDVSLPRDHRMANIERPSILRLELRESPENHFVIKEITNTNSDEFYGQLSQRVEKSKGKEAFVFIHGFRVTFDDAVYRTAQIAYDLAFAGAPVLYSWPSNGKIYEYIGDLNNNDWSTDHLRMFLADLASRSGATTIHLIAHSMGNRVLVNALNLIAMDRVALMRPCFSQIVLTAPDIDADLFTRIAKVIRTTGKRVTVYASKHDRALKASKKLNGSYPRAGDIDESVMVVRGVDTIDASAVDTNLIGHFYYAENRSVLSDIFSLLRDGRAPENRFGIRAVPAVPPYWRFAP